MTDLFISATVPTPGDTVRGFALGPCVAHSLHARVFRANDGHADAALKWIAVADHAAARGPLEARALARIVHPSVSRMLDAGSYGTGYAIATAWIDGDPLGGLVGAPLPWSRARAIVAAIGAGLGAMHTAGVVHRDLKPANVLLPHSGDPAAVIVDFSHAWLADTAEGERVTEPGMVTGSAAYMAPEQATGAPVDGRADLYSLGVVLYELLTGELPHQAASVAQMMRAHQRDAVVAPRTRAPHAGIPAGAEELCMWLLTKDRDHRMPNARVLALALTSIPEGASQ